MRRAVAAVLLAVSGAGSLVACGTPEPTVLGSTWQVTDVWVTPGDPSAVPDGGTLVFGEASLAGSTGCAPIQGTVTFTRDGETVQAADADAVTVDRLEIDVPAADCPAAWTHELLTTMLGSGATFDLRQDTDTELVLTLRGEGVDRPAIGLAAV